MQEWIFITKNGLPLDSFLFNLSLYFIIYSLLVLPQAKLSEVFENWNYEIRKSFLHWSEGRRASCSEQFFFFFFGCQYWPKVSLTRGRSSRPEVFCKKGFLKKIHRKTLCLSLFLNKVAGLLQGYIFPKKNECKIMKRELFCWRFFLSIFECKFEEAPQTSKLFC